MVEILEVRQKMNFLIKVITTIISGIWEFISPFLEVIFITVVSLFWGYSLIHWILSWMFNGDATKWFIFWICTNAFVFYVYKKS